MVQSFWSEPSIISINKGLPVLLRDNHGLCAQKFIYYYRLTTIMAFIPRPVRMHGLLNEKKKSNQMIVIKITVSTSLT